MSNELLNAHIAFGEPCGEEAEFSVIADWAGQLLLTGVEESNSHKYFSKQDVLKIVDACFHALASSSRNEALELAEEIIDNYSSKK